jgi:hypothetical protein
VIVFKRQADGSYQQSGELPKGTRYATVHFYRDGVLSGGYATKSVKEWVEIIAGATHGKDYYELHPAPSPRRPMSEQTKAALRARKGGRDE